MGQGCQEVLRGQQCSRRYDSRHDGLLCGIFNAEDWENLRHKAYAAVYPDSEFLSEKFLCSVCAESRIQAVRGKSSCIDIRYLVIQDVYKRQAERFGLAQLHQLRGRVGRSSFQSYCVLLSQDKENERLQTMAATTDGFKIAEKDLELRGTGQILGVKQSGKDMYMETMLKYPKLYKEIRTQASKDVLLAAKKS